MQYINKIDKNNKKEKVILIGKGPSIDLLNLKFLNKQQEFDIMTISESCKLIKNPKFGIHYHVDTVRRSEKAIFNPQNILLNESFLTTYINKFKTVIPKVESTPHLYFFKSNHIKLPHIITKQFDLNVSDKLFNYCGSIVGSINFLCGYMNYKEIYYVGFDGGIHPGEAQYSERLYFKRKEAKIEGCKLKYAQSWKGALEMLKHYPDVKFLPLNKFLLKKEN